MDPLTKGDYPEIMKELVGDRLPKFNETESKLVKDSFDFLGLNYYFTQYVYAIPQSPPNKLSVMTDSQSDLSYVNADGPIGPWFNGNQYYRPRGVLDVLEYFKTKYNNPLVYITENGISTAGNVTHEEAIADSHRSDYLCSHLCFLRKAIKESGCNVKGYIAWSLADNYEFCLGFTVKFGITYVEADRDLKESGQWYKRFLAPTNQTLNTKLISTKTKDLVGTKVFSRKAVA